MSVSSLTSPIAAQQTFGMQALGAGQTGNVPAALQNAAPAAPPATVDTITLSAQAQAAIAAAKTANTVANTQATSQAFISFAHAGPVERMHAQVLQSMGLTPQQVNAMPPDQRKAVEAQVSQAFKAAMH